ncbi:hypothetical protein GALMADRAFT_161784 [Galerina marginata CBS 339.88]|uniref:Uncharacterized protein n=1 Tax=Galerina marginata (strain CBS 339.88) TaxID=685588 RepID=A0A067SAL8_GALM3|nr:hypothetical protein GALMADRAFT_161784 [Galerina marginata CBS 339.88]
MRMVEDKDKWSKVVLRSEPKPQLAVPKDDPQRDYSRPVLGNFINAVLLSTASSHTARRKGKSKGGISSSSASSSCTSSSAAPRRPEELDSQLRPKDPHTRLALQLPHPLPPTREEHAGPTPTPVMIDKHGRRREQHRQDKEANQRRLLLRFLLLLIHCPTRCPWKKLDSWFVASPNRRQNPNFVSSLPEPPAPAAAPAPARQTGSARGAGSQERSNRVLA